MKFDKSGILFEEVVFEAFRSELSVSIPQFNKNLLIGADLAIQTRLDNAPKHVNTISPQAPDDVRIYFGTADVTPYCLKVIQDLIDTMDQNALAAQYLTAMNSFISYADSLETAMTA